MALLDFLFKPKKIPAGVNATLQSHQIEGYNANRPLNTTKTFCLAPTVNMLFAQDGTVRVCCNNMEHAIGKYPEQSIEEIWNSPKAIELRQAMADFNLSKGCRVCQEIMDVNEYAEPPSLYFDSYTPGKGPKMMEFLITNTCNLECVMCQGEFSSLIRKNREKLPPLKFPYDSNFIEQIKPYLVNLEEARFSGSGEAFAIDMYYEMWEFIINKNPNCRIAIQTNGTYMNERIRDLLSRGNFYIGISLDSLQKERYESIRVNALYERVIENVNYLANYSAEKNRPFYIATCVMRNNWDELPAFVDFASKLNCLVHFHQVYYPQHLSLQTWPAEKLQHVYEVLSTHNFEGSGKTYQRNVQHYSYFLKIIKTWLDAALQKQAAETLTTVPYNYEQKLLELVEGMNIAEADKETFLLKFRKVIDSQKSEEQKRQIYGHVLQQNPETFVSAVLKFPEEYLIEQSENLLKV